MSVAVAAGGMRGYLRRIWGFLGDNRSGAGRVGSGDGGDPRSMSISEVSKVPHLFVLLSLLSKVRAESSNRKINYLAGLLEKVVCSFGNFLDFGSL